MNLFLYKNLKRTMTLYSLTKNVSDYIKSVVLKTSSIFLILTAKIHFLKKGKKKKCFLKKDHFKQYLLAEYSNIKSVICILFLTSSRTGRFA